MATPAPPSSQVTALVPANEPQLTITANITGTEPRSSAKGDTFTVYCIRVRCGAKEWVVAHRYKEFERLHKEVKRVFPKEEVPAFPKKTLFQSAMSLKVIEERRIGLEMYLQSLLDAQAYWRLEALVRFLDDDDNTLTLQLNVLHMLHSQKRLSRLALRNRSRAKLMETKLRESQQQVDELRSRMHRLEGVLGAQGFQSSKSSSRRRASAAGSEDRRLPSTLSEHSSSLAAAASPVLAPKRNLPQVLAAEENALRSRSFGDAEKRRQATALATRAQRLAVMSSATNSSDDDLAASPVLHSGPLPRSSAIPVTAAANGSLMMQRTLGHASWPRVGTSSRPAWTVSTSGPVLEVDSQEGPSSPVGSSLELPTTPTIPGVRDSFDSQDSSSHLFPQAKEPPRRAVSFTQPSGDIASARLRGNSKESINSSTEPESDRPRGVASFTEGGARVRVGWRYYPVSELSSEVLDFAAAALRRTERAMTGDTSEGDTSGGEEGSSSQSQRAISGDFSAGRWLAETAQRRAWPGMASESPAAAAARLSLSSQIGPGARSDLSIDEAFEQWRSGSSPKGKRSRDKEPNTAGTAAASTTASEALRSVSAHMAGSAGSDVAATAPHSYSPAASAAPLSQTTAALAVSPTSLASAARQGREGGVASTSGMAITSPATLPLKAQWVASMDDEGRLRSKSDPAGMDGTTYLKAQGVKLVVDRLARKGQGPQTVKRKEAMVFLAGPELPLWAPQVTSPQALLGTTPPAQPIVLPRPTLSREDVFRRLFRGCLDASSLAAFARLQQLSQAAAASGAASASASSSGHPASSTAGSVARGSSWGLGAFVATYGSTEASDLSVSLPLLPISNLSATSVAPASSVILCERFWLPQLAYLESLPDTVNASGMASHSFLTDLLQLLRTTAPETSADILSDNTPTHSPPAASPTSARGASPGSSEGSQGGPAAPWWASAVCGDMAVLSLLAACDGVVAAVRPTVAAHQRRSSILEYMTNLVRRSLGAAVFATGSFSLLTYLPDGDIDVSALLARGQEEDWFVSVNETLCMAATQSKLQQAMSRRRGPAQLTEEQQPQEASQAPRSAGRNKKNSSNVAALGGEMPWHLEELSKHQVRNVTFVNAEVALVRAVVDNVSMDVSANQAPAIVVACFLETIDRWIGQDHLFKRSVLLIKAFCHYESQRLCGRSVLGSGTGGLSSYAMQVLLFALFNSSPFRIKHPLQALVLFFQTYASVPWSTVRITIYGVEPLYIPAGSRSVQGRYIHDAMLKPFRSRAERLSGSRDPSAVREFEIRSCNVEDPLLPWNNVARSVSRKSFPNLVDAFGAANNVLFEVLTEFMVTAPAAAPGTAVEMLPPSLSDSKEAEAVEAAMGDVWRHVVGAMADTMAPEGSSPGSGAEGGRKAAAPGALPAVKDLAAAKAVWRRTFDSIIHLYCKGDAWREDLLVHPMQESLGRHAPPPEDCAFEPLAGNVLELANAVEYAGVVLSADITAPALVALTEQILGMRGAAPVGEIGKLLQEATGNAQLPAVIKENWGGLKKFLEAHSEQFYVGVDHPFNPHVCLVRNLHKFPKLTVPPSKEADDEDGGASVRSGRSAVSQQIGHSGGNDTGGGGRKSHGREASQQQQQRYGKAQGRNGLSHAAYAPSDPIPMPHSHRHSAAAMAWSGIGGGSGFSPSPSYRHPLQPPSMAAAVAGMSGGGSGASSVHTDRSNSGEAEPFLWRSAMAGPSAQHSAAAAGGYFLSSPVEMAAPGHGRAMELSSPPLAVSGQSPGFGGFFGGYPAMMAHSPMLPPRGDAAAMGGGGGSSGMPRRTPMRGKGTATTPPPLSIGTSMHYPQNPYGSSGHYKQ